MSLDTEKDNRARTATLRPAQASDEQFLFDLYSSTRSEEIAVWGWSREQQEMFLKLQFTAQQRHYEIAFAGAEHRIIFMEELAIGRILVFRAEREIRLVDIALLPDYRGRGIGAFLIKELIEEAESKGVPLTLHVEKHNRAARLYDRLGFSVTSDAGTHFKIEWLPDNQ